MTTPNLRERVARAIEESLYGTERIGRTDTLQYGLEADAAIAIVLEEAAKAGDELGCECEGCGHLCGDPMIDMEIIRKAGGVSCCPERKMRPIGSAIRALKDT